MVEQNAKKALQMSDRGYVLAAGPNKYEDTGHGLLNNEGCPIFFRGLRFKSKGRYLECS